MTNTQIFYSFEEKTFSVVKFAKVDTKGSAPLDTKELHGMVSHPGGRRDGGCAGAGMVL